MTKFLILTSIVLMLVSGVNAQQRTFIAEKPTVTRQGPDSIYDRLTPLVTGAKVAVDETKNGWHRSISSGAWIDGRSGKLENTSYSNCQVKRLVLDKTSEGDALLTIETNWVPEISAIHQPNQRTLSLTLFDSSHTIFDLKRPTQAAPFLGAVMVRPLTNPHAVQIDIDTLGQLGGYQLRPGTKPGTVEVLLKRPVARTFKDLVITLDAGHGGSTDPGTVGHLGLAEKTLNLRVTKRLAKKLRDLGAKVIMTRTGDSDVSGGQDRSELQSRIDVSKNKGGQLFLSLHHNARPNVEEGKRYHGTDVYWYQPQSQALASALADPIADAVGEELRSFRWRSFYVIRQTHSPSVLIEFQYLSNPALEKNILDQSDYAEKASQGVVNGLKRYLAR